MIFYKGNWKRYICLFLGHKWERVDKFTTYILEAFQLSMPRGSYWPDDEVCIRCGAEDLKFGA